MFVKIGRPIFRRVTEKECSGLEMIHVRGNSEKA